MIREKLNVGRNTDTDVMNIGLVGNDIGKVKMVGEITDKIYKNGKLIDVRVGHNLIVNSFLNLAMALMKGENGYSGIQYWAIGSGADSWDSTTPDPAANATQLTNEIGRVAILPAEIKFVNAEYEESVNPTNILQIEHTFGTADCNGKWREFGLFGGNATATTNSGILINKKHHAVLTKTSDMTIDRTMRFTLTLSE